MTADEIKRYLFTLSLTEALWWYIENISQDDPAQSEVFFYLRARYRREVQHAT